MADDDRTVHFEGCFEQLSQDSKEYIINVMNALIVAQHKEKDVSSGKTARNKQANNENTDHDKNPLFD